MKKLNLWKRTIAGVLSLLVVAGVAPVYNNSGILGGSNVIVAYADDALTDISADTPQDGQNDFVKYDKKSNTINAGGIINKQYIQSTFSDKGYNTAVKIGDNDMHNLTDFAYGKLYTYDGVQFRIIPEFTANGRAVVFKYQLHNTTDSPLTVKIGSYADTKVGNNDSATVGFEGNAIYMEDTGNGNKFTLVPGDDAFTTRWYGYYGKASSHVFDGDMTDNWKVYGGYESTDSGIAWSWTVELAAGETAERSATMKVARSLEIHDCSLTADLENSQMILNVPYTDKQNLTQTLHYTIDDSEDLGGDTNNTQDNVEKTFEKTINVGEGGLNWAAGSEHTFKFWLTNNANPSITSAMLTYRIYWTGVNDNSNELKTLKLSSKSGNLFAGIKAPNGTNYPLPADSWYQHRFLGWSENADGTGTLYTAGTEYEISADKTLYAQFIPCFDITYDANGATGGTAPISHQKDKDVDVTLAANTGSLERTGYTFTGWNTSEYGNGTHYDVSAAYTANASAKLYAEWTAIPATAPTISTQPSDLNLTYGYTSGNVLSVSASAATDTTYNALTYQWYKSTTSVSAGFSAIGGANSASYTVPTEKSANTTEYYYCVVTAKRTDNNQTATATSSVATVTVGKAAPDHTAPVLQGTSLTHYSSDLELINTAGSLNNEGQGTMYYAVTEVDEAPAADAEKVWKTDIKDIKATKAGTYYVWYKIAGVDNYELAPTKAGSVRVSQYSYYSQSWTLKMDSYNFDGTAHTPTIVGNAYTYSYTAIEYTYFNADTDEELDGAPFEPGNYRVKVYADGGTGYYGRTQWATYSITDNAEANLEAVKSATSFKYDTPYTKILNGNRIVANATASVSDSEMKIVRTGIVYWNASDTPTCTLNLTNAKRLADVKKLAESKTSSIGANFLDKGFGVRIKAYAVVSYKGKEYTVYATSRYYKYNALAKNTEKVKAAVSFSFTKPTTKIGNGNRVLASTTAKVTDDNFKIVRTGLIYWNASEKPRYALNLKNVEKYEEVKKISEAEGDTKNGNFLDKGYGVTIRGYAVVSYDGQEYVVYSPTRYYRYDRLAK